MNEITTQSETSTPTLIYAIYFVALFTGVPFLIGVVIAYLARDGANPAARSHYDHQIAIFWRVLLGGIAVALLIGAGIPLSLILIGIPMVILGALLALYLFIWTLVRCFRGVQASSNGQAYTGSQGWAI